MRLIKLGLIANLITGPSYFNLAVS